MSMATGYAAAGGRKSEDVKDYVPSWSGGPKTFPEYGQPSKWYMRGTRKGGRCLLAFRLARRLTGNAYNQKKKLAHEDMEKEDGVLYLLRVLKKELVAKDLSDLAIRIVAWPMVHRKPGQSAVGYYADHDRVVDDLEESLKATEKVENAPKLLMKLVSFLTLERFGFADQEKTVIRTRTGKDSARRT